MSKRTRIVALILAIFICLGLVAGAVSGILAIL